MFSAKKLSLLLLCAVVIADHSPSAASSPNPERRVLTLKQAVEQAIKVDPWLKGNQLQQQALQARGIASGSLPDPQVSVGLANLPVESFSFSQEPMTQLKVSVSQMLPRGKSLELKQRQFTELSAQMPHLRENRRGEVTKTVANLWLDAYLSQQTISIIESNRSLFEQLVDITEAKYSRAVSGTRQQDLIRAQLELSRLEDRLTTLKQQNSVALASLNRWIAPAYGDELTLGETEQGDGNPFFPTYLLAELPNIGLIQSLEPAVQSRFELLSQHFANHPLVKAIEWEEKAKQSQVELAKQSYKPSWGINASYGYREDSPAGMPRDDFFSVGVTFDLPLFTENRQGQEVAAAIAERSAVKTRRWQVLRELMGSYLSYSKALERFTERMQLYKQQLIPQMKQQAEAALNAYNNDDGDFAEVVRAHIAELEAEIQLLTIEVNRQKVLIELNYLLAEKAEQILMPATVQE